MNNSQKENAAGKSADGRSWNMKSLNNRHKELLRLLLQGHRLGSAAKMLHMNHDTAKSIAQASLFKFELARLQEEANKLAVLKAAESITSPAEQVLHDGALGAAGRLVELVGSDDEKIGLSASNSVLDRTGHKGKIEDNRANVIINVSEAKMAIIADSLIEVKNRENGFGGGGVQI